MMMIDRKSTRLNSSHSQISYAVFCLKKKKNNKEILIMTITLYLYICTTNNNYFLFFLNTTSTSYIYTLSLHDALPIYSNTSWPYNQDATSQSSRLKGMVTGAKIKILGTSTYLYSVKFYDDDRSEEHTSELQSQSNLVCRLLLEKKKK